MCELTPEHDVSACTRKEAPEDYRPANPSCSLVEELRDRMNDIEKRVLELENRI